jgi:four helix bundle protein
MGFHYENLNVYRRAIEIVGKAKTIADGWEGKYAITDHFLRAYRGIPGQIAVGTLQRTKAAAQAKYDVAVGSCLECAACLDLAGVYDLNSSRDIQDVKTELSAVVKMTVGLRRSAERNLAREKPADYTREHKPPQSLFYHEDLEVYQASLQFASWLRQLWSKGTTAEDFCFQRLDAPTTSMILNIAEGNSRFQEKDHRRFLGYAQDAAVKTATTLDMAVEENILTPPQIRRGKSHLERVTAMLVKMIGEDAYY